MRDMRPLLTRMAIVSFQDLLVLYLGLDTFLLEPPLVRDPPPYWTFIFASHVKIHTSTTCWVTLITLLPAQATSKAAY